LQKPQRSLQARRLWALPSWERAGRSMMPQATTPRPQWTLHGGRLGLSDLLARVVKSTAVPDTEGSEAPGNEAKGKPDPTETPGKEAGTPIAAP